MLSIEISTNHSDRNPPKCSIVVLEEYFHLWAINVILIVWIGNYTDNISLSLSLSSPFWMIAEEGLAKVSPTHPSSYGQRLAFRHKRPVKRKKPDVFISSTPVPSFFSFSTSLASNSRSRTKTASALHTRVMNSSLL